MLNLGTCRDMKTESGLPKINSPANKLPSKLYIMGNKKPKRLNFQSKLAETAFFDNFTHKTQTGEGSMTRASMNDSMSNWNNKWVSK